MFLFQVVSNCLTLLSMVCEAWCTDSLLQGLLISSTSQTKGGHKSDHRGTHDKLPWLLPLTLSSLLKKEPWLQITGKVFDGKPEFSTSSDFVYGTLCHTKYLTYIQEIATL